MKKQRILRKDVIKFKSIELYLKLKNGNSTEQEKLDNIMKSFIIDFTHLGDNDYKLNDKIHTLKTETLSDIRISFQLKEPGVPQVSTLTYDKLKNGQYSLSPSATWKLQLIEDKEDADFDDLKKYANDVDLELGGFGYYLEIKHDEEFKSNHEYNSDQVCDLPPRVKNQSLRGKRDVGSMWEKFVNYFS